MPQASQSSWAKCYAAVTPGLWGPEARCAVPPILYHTGTLLSLHRLCAASPCQRLRFLLPAHTKKEHGIDRALSWPVRVVVEFTGRAGGSCEQAFLKHPSATFPTLWQLTPKLEEVIVMAFGPRQ
jgi:hypothetical protein